MRDNCARHQPRGLRATDHRPRHPCHHEAKGSLTRERPPWRSPPRGASSPPSP